MLGLLGRLGLLPLDAPLIIDTVDCGFGADEAFEIGLDEYLERGRFLLNGAREEVEAGEERVGRGIAVDLGEEEGRGEACRA